MVSIFSSLNRSSFKFIKLLNLYEAEVHDETWWRARFEMYGFVYSPELTQKVKELLAKKEKNDKIDFPVQIRDKIITKYNAQHVWFHMMVSLEYF